MTDSASLRDQVADGTAGAGAGSPFSFDQSTGGHHYMLHHPLPAGHQLQHSQSQSNNHKSSGTDPAPRRQQQQQANNTTHSLSGGIGAPATNRRSGNSGGALASTNLRPSSSTAGSTQRLSSGSVGGGGGGGGNSMANRDHSVTQYALIDDDNVSALQQMTRGGGALTMASQWKSQFDDSEETTDNEWKQEPQSPSHHCGPASHSHQRHASAGPPVTGKGQHTHQYQHMVGTQSTDLDMAAAAAAAVRKRAHLNIAGIESYEHLQDVLPHCWSEPALGNVLRDRLEPPVLQQAAFDDTVSIGKWRNQMFAREREKDVFFVFIFFRSSGWTLCVM